MPRDTGRWTVLVPYPRAALNGQPKIAPAATPSTATEVLSIYQPVMATNVVYIQKLLGRKAARIKKRGTERGRETRVWGLLGVIKILPTLHDVNNQEHILRNILELCSKGICLQKKKIKFNDFPYFLTLVFLGTNTCLVIQCQARHSSPGLTPNPKLREFQAIFSGRE